MTGVAFVDTETTGLDPDVHEVWEVALIVPDATESSHRVGPGEYVWHLPVDLGRADPIALRIGRYHARYGRMMTPNGSVSALADVREFARDFARLTRGRHLVGAVVSFDEERLRRLLRANGACPEWHYHLIDCEALAVGYLHADDGLYDKSPIALPWDSEALSRAVGIEPERFDRHTALGDAKWAQAIYETIVG